MDKCRTERKITMKRSSLFPIFASLALGLLAVLPAAAQKEIPVVVASPESAPVKGDFSTPVLAPVPNRVVGTIDDSRLVVLRGNTHPMARPMFDRGPLTPEKLLERMVLVLKRSPEQEQALHDFNERQYDPNSPDYHRWLEPEEFGKLYGPSDADMAAVTSWLEGHGFQIYNVSKGRVTIEFTGTVAQVQQAFHLEMHNYLVHGEQHIANDRDPQIPEALEPVITGIASLHDFFPKPQMVLGKTVKRDIKTGKITLYDPKAPGAGGGVHPDLGYLDQNNYVRMDVTPYDFATIYNELPLWNASTPIIGTGVTIAISGISDVATTDFNSFRSSFGLPAKTLNIIHNGTDPGLDPSGGQGENSLDVEWSGASAPGANITMVVTGSTSTTFGGQLSNSYIVDNKTAPIMSASYGGCELGQGTAGNSALNAISQQGATEGMSIFISAGDQGSAGCGSQDTPAPNSDTIGLQVNGWASSPYVTAVGGTDLNWDWWKTGGWSTYWASSNGANGETALGYIPEIPWNSTCTSPTLFNVFTAYSNPETLCNAAAGDSTYYSLVVIGAGSGGVSHCTTNSTTSTSTSLDPTSCSGGYAKPSWQTGTGVPADGKRDVPDISLFASGSYPAGLPGSAFLFCMSTASSNNCDYSSNQYIIYQEIGGTSASSPAMAGIMALVVQKAGGAWQGLANPALYKLAAKQTYSSCSTNAVTNSGSCYFNDIVSGTIAQVCTTGDPNCVTSTSGDAYGVLSGYSSTTGYDLATGLGSLNVANVVNGWSSVSGGTPAITLTPSAVTFPGSTVVGSTDATTESLTVKSSGTSAVTFTGFEISGTNSTSFTATTTCPTAPLAVGSTCTVTFTFVPQTSGTNTASLKVSFSGGAGSASATLTGTGVASGSPAVTFTPSSLSFASTVEGSETAAQSVTLKNTGSATLVRTAGGITFSGTNGTSFVETATTCGSTVAVGATCTISVAFKPVAVGALTGNLSVADNGTGSPQLVKLTGTGTAGSSPIISLSATKFTFANTVTNATSEAQALTVTNTGGATAIFSSKLFTGTNPTSFQKYTTCGTSLAAGAVCKFFVAFKPATTGALTANISIADNAGGSPQTVALSGTGTPAPTVTLSATSVAFSSTTHLTASSPIGVNVTNNGSATLHLMSIAIGGLQKSSFSQMNTCPITLAPAATCTIYVDFYPATTGALTATLTLTDNGAASPQNITLSGTGK
jgi:hypothetical protein